jgi:hypothetical protein
MSPLTKDDLASCELRGCCSLPKGRSNVYIVGCASRFLCWNSVPACERTLFTHSTPRAPRGARARGARFFSPRACLGPHQGRGIGKVDWLRVGTSRACACPFGAPLDPPLAPAARGHWHVVPPCRSRARRARQRRGRQRGGSHKSGWGGLVRSVGRRLALAHVVGSPLACQRPHAISKRFLFLYSIDFFDLVCG